MRVKLDGFPLAMGKGYATLHGKTLAMSQDNVRQNCCATVRWLRPLAMGKVYATLGKTLAMGKPPGRFKLPP